MRKIVNFSVIFLAILIVFLAFFSTYLTPYSPNEANLADKFLSISQTHLLGTDHLGRDVFSRLVYGAGVSLKSVFATIFLIVILGISIGGISGFVGGKVDHVIMRFCDVFISFPTVVLALFLVGILGTGLTNVIIAIALTHWAWYARIIRSIVLSFKSREYVLITASCGASKFQNFKKNMLKPILAQCAVLATLDLGHIMLHISGLSFLGLGVKAPTPEWGIMISDAKEYIFTHSELILYPGLALLMTVCVFNMLGDMLRDKLDCEVVINEHY